LFGTTSSFLEVFGLRALSDLPPLREVESLIAAPAAEGEAEASALEPLGNGVAEHLSSDDLDEAPGEPPRESADGARDGELLLH
jgi:hypothetical protein